MPSLTFQLPVPAAALSPNARGHWTGKASVTKKARLAAKEEGIRVCVDAGIAPPRWAKAKYVPILMHLGARTPDPGNFLASLKAYEDGLQDAGIVVNDRALWPERPVFCRVERLPCVMITVTPEPIS